MEFQGTVNKFLDAIYYKKSGNKVSYHSMVEAFGHWLKTSGVSHHEEFAHDLEFFLPEEYPMVVRKGKDATYVLNLIAKPSEALNWIEVRRSKLKEAISIKTDYDLTDFELHANKLQEALLQDCTCKEHGDCQRCQDIQYETRLIDEIGRKYV